MKLRDALFALPLFLLVFEVYVTSPAHESMDSRYSIHLANSIITEGNLDLDEYSSNIVTNDYRTERVDGHLYSYFPIGNSVLAVPLLVLWSFVDPSYRAGAEEIFLTAELQLGSFFAALAVIIIYFIGRHSLSPAKSVVLALAFAFGTSAWSIASRALWEVGASMLLLSGTLLILLAARRRPWLVQFAGIPLAYSYFTRPTNSISIVLLTLYVFLEYRKFIFGYLLGAALTAAPFLWINLQIYGSLLSPYYHTAKQIGDTRDFLGALAGNLLSPARGLFIFSPFLLLSGVGVFFKVKQGGLSRLDYALLLIIGLHWAALATHHPWWGGWTFGPRQMTDMLPYFVFFLIPVVDRATNSTTSPLALTFGALLAASMFIHYQGATNPATVKWNFIPVSLDMQPSRVWDWRDPQFLRGSARFDRLMPQSIEVSEARVAARRRPGQKGSASARIAIHLSRGGSFDWKAEAGAGVTLSSDHGENVTKAAPLVAVAAADDLPGTYPVGEVRISARPSNNSAAEWQSVTVPVDLAVSYGYYVPSVFCAAR
jgi:hypothetical protein